MKRAQARQKGHQWEREVAQDFRDIGFPEAERNLEYQISHAKAGIDLIGTYPFNVQCKFHKDYLSVNTINEVNAEMGAIAILVMKANRKEPMAVMRWKDLKEILTVFVKANRVQRAIK